MPWDVLLEWISPSLGGAIVLSLAVLFAWNRRWFVSGETYDQEISRLTKERDAERIRAETSEAKVVSLLEDQIQAFRDEKRIAEIIAGRQRATASPGEHTGGDSGDSDAI
jgi:hypothetical protein